MTAPLQNPQRLQRLVEVLARTAADVARVRDIEEVLALICSRTRMLVDSDMAYISLNDTGLGETYIRATDGVRTQEYRNLRMPHGTGVLGVAAGGERTFMTSDYHHDPSIVHIPYVDAAVMAEGVRSILASPLRIEGTVIGALLIAERSVREYGEEERLIIESLAPQAAVAVENARLFRAQNVALENERIARAEASLRLSQVQRLTRAEQAFGDALSAPDGFEALTLALGHAIDSPVAAFDVTGTIVAGTLADTDKDVAAEAIHEALTRAATVGASRAAAGNATRNAPTVLPGVTIDGRPAALTLSIAREATIGGFLTSAEAASPTPAGPGDESAAADTNATILSRASTHLAALLLFQRTLDDSRFRQERDLMSALTALSPGDETRALEASLQKLSRGNPAPATSRAIIVLEVEQPLHVSALRAMRGSGLVSVAASHEGHVCGVYDASKVQPSQFTEVLRQAIGRFVGGAAEFTSLVAAARAHREATYFAQAATRLGRTREIATRGTFGTAALLAGGSDHDLVGAIIGEQVGLLEEYDLTHGTALLVTCEAWLERGRSVTQAAADLFVHVNTVRQRLDRVTEVLGEGWADGSHTFDLHLALRLRRLRGV